MATSTPLSKALDTYAKAVAKRAYWEHNGRHGDGMLEAAKVTERAARRAVIAAAKA